MAHEGMSGTAHSILCPLMGGASPVCAHSSFPEVPVLPTVFVLALLSVLLLVTLRLAPLVLLRLRHYLLPPPYYQELFSSGILNSKRH